jgi:hypothetical protein
VQTPSSFLRLAVATATSSRSRKPECHHRTASTAVDPNQREKKKGIKNASETRKSLLGLFVTVVYLTRDRA